MLKNYFDILILIILTAVVGVVNADIHPQNVSFIIGISAELTLYVLILFAILSIFGRDFEDPADPYLIRLHALFYTLFGVSLILSIASLMGPRAFHHMGRVVSSPEFLRQIRIVLAACGACILLIMFVRSNAPTGGRIIRSRWFWITVVVIAVFSLIGHNYQRTHDPDVVGTAPQSYSQPPYGTPPAQQTQPAATGHVGKTNLNQQQPTPPLGLK